jgi:transposase
MQALVAARFNPALKTKYDHLIDAGRPAKAVITAIARKLATSASNALPRSALNLCMVNFERAGFTSGPKTLY